MTFASRTFYRDTIKVKPIIHVGERGCHLHIVPITHLNSPGISVPVVTCDKRKSN